MREAIANVGVFNIMIIFIIVLLALFTGSLSYSKAFKVKDMIISEIQRDQDYNEDTQTRIENSLKDIGYRVSGFNSHECKYSDNESAEALKPSNETKYEYCVYKINECGENNDNGRCGRYYRVTAYMYFDVPIVGDMIRIPVNGETITFYDLRS